MLRRGKTNKNSVRFRTLYNGSMARGWESKSAEIQMESAESDKHSTPRKNSRTSAELNIIREKEGLLLSRTRVLREMDSSQNPRYKAILNKALADLDAKLARLV
ncbi:MAG: hypothetical protein M1541_04645 [Acidobacteria bacterium]|nr:hypothetical protein [Acidobacteriota bacterium]